MKAVSCCQPSSRKLIQADGRKSWEELRRRVVLAAAAMWPTAVVLLPLAGVPAATNLPPLHRTVCGNGTRTCRPGEGNPSVTHSENPYDFGFPADYLKTPPHSPDPTSPQYAPLVTAAEAVKGHHRLIYMCVADFDFREVAQNWFRAIQRFGLSNAIVYSLDPETRAYLAAAEVPTVDGSANIAAWNRTRLGRHMQRVDAEKHLAAAALVAAGFDVLLTDATHVMMRDATPALHALTKDASTHAIDAAVARSGHWNGRPPLGVALAWNLVLLRGTSRPEERERVVRWQVAGVQKGLVDFYLRWWNGNHCINNGFGKLWGDCNPALEANVTIEAMAKRDVTVTATCRGGGAAGLRLGVLPPSFFDSPNLYGRNEPVAGTLFGRSAKPEQRDRLRLDRYDAQDFVELHAAMKADGLWLL